MVTPPFEYSSHKASALPTCRLWYSFLAPPRIDLSARPVLGGRVLRYGAILNGVSALLRSKLLRAVHKQL
eukprot:scaffold152595_cov18-Tisochrysis_lutea.AAC.1